MAEKRRNNKSPFFTGRIILSQELNIVNNYFNDFLDYTVREGAGANYATYSRQLRETAKKSRKYGYVFDTNVSTQYSGLNAMRDMNAVVDKMKTLKIDSVAGIGVDAIRDYSSGVKTLKDGSVQNMEVEKVNAVYYELSNGGFICVRPSGTEPKLKVYYSLPAESEEMAKDLFEKVKTEFEKYVK